MVGLPVRVTNRFDCERREPTTSTSTVEYEPRPTSSLPAGEVNLSSSAKKVRSGPPTPKAFANFSLGLPQPQESQIDTPRNAESVRESFNPKHTVRQSQCDTSLGTNDIHLEKSLAGDALPAFQCIE